MAAIVLLSCGVTGDGEPLGFDGDHAGQSKRQPDSRRVQSEDALAVVRGIQRRFRLPAAPMAVLAEAQAQRFERDGQRLKPVLPHTVVAAAARPAQVSFPARATGPFVVTDEASGLSMTVTLGDALDVPAELAGGYLVYRGALESGADVVHRVTTEGTEDFVLFEHASAEAADSSVEYSVGLGSGVAGLRLVANTLELLDAAGAPRLRVAPPYLIDGDGARHDATLAVEGCAVDTNPAAPWGRRVTVPGAHECTVRVAWDGDAVAYPAVLDPSWTVTGSMAGARYLHTATLLTNGRVLVAGGYNGAALPTAELYDPATGTWSITDSLGSARQLHTSELLVDGRVIAVGGLGGAALATTELYDPVLGTWSATGSLTEARYYHSTSRLLGGHVVVVGGLVSPAGYSASAERYDPGLGTWAPTGSMAEGRRQHTASVLADGRVLVAGGFGSGGPPGLSSAEIYDPASGMWAATGTMATARYIQSASVLADGRVLIAGGYGLGGAQSSAELFDPTPGTWSTTGSMTAARWLHSASVTASGRVLTAGGYGVPALTSAELYDPASGMWNATVDMTTARYGHSATVLQGGHVLAAGGIDSVAHSSAELYAELRMNGEACSLGTECTSGNCVDSVCCDEACGGGVAGDCQACDLLGAEGMCTPEAPGMACGDGVDTECTNPDSCDGTGTCDANHETDGFACGGGTCLSGVCDPSNLGGAGGAGGSGGVGGNGGTAGNGGVGGIAMGGTGGLGGFGGMGGNGGTGGAMAAGGTTAAGGSAPTGGGPASGGSPATGGTPATGGAQGTGASNAVAPASDAADDGSCRFVAPPLPRTRSVWFMLLAIGWAAIRRPQTRTRPSPVRRVVG